MAEVASNSRIDAHDLPPLEGMTMNDSEAPKPKRRWYQFTPDRFVLALLAVEVFLLLSERFQWFTFSGHKGWTVLISLAAVGAAVLFLPLWFLVSLVCRWRFQFSLRTLLIVVLVLCLPLGWLGEKVRQARRHQETVKAIEEAGGYVGHEYEVLGLDLGDVDYVGLGRDSGDAELEDLKEQLEGLTGLRALDVDCCYGITDAGMEHLQGLNNLKWLNISHTKVTEAGLEDLKGMTNLEVLYVCCLYKADKPEKISDEDFKKLQEALPNCRIIGP